MRFITAVLSVTLCYALCVCDDVPAQKNFDLQKFSGKWYRLAVACNSQRFSAFKDRMRTSMYVMTPLDSGDVNVTVSKQRSSGCHTRDITYHKTPVPGKFTYYSNHHQKMKRVTIVESNYSSYAIVQNNIEETNEYMKLSLYGRSQSLGSELTEKFKQLALSRGYSEEAIRILPPAAEQCFPMNM